MKFSKNSNATWNANIPKMNFMPTQSGTYVKILLSSFPLILGRAILDKPFAASVRRSLPWGWLDRAIRRPSLLGRGPTGRAPHC